jgi:hypothetical protein
VILPGGEVGLLKTWWNHHQGREWRWMAKFYSIDEGGQPFDRTCRED